MSQVLQMLINADIFSVSRNTWMMQLCLEVLHATYKYIFVQVYWLAGLTHSSHTYIRY